MDGKLEWVAPPERPASSELPWLGADAMVTETVVDQVVQARARGEAVAAVARACGLDRKTVRMWEKRGTYVPRTPRPVLSCLDPYKDWLACRAPEVGYNATVLFRELRERGFAGSVIIVRRAVVPLRTTATPPAATVRYETAPGAQAQVDFGQTRVWIADAHEVAQIFVLDARLLAPLSRGRVSLAFHPTYADFCGYYGVRPCACQPYRPQTKGKVESGVKYVVRNALAGQRFFSWAHLNTWLLEWAATIADQREHGTTHEIPAVRFAREALTPLDGRPAYALPHTRERKVATDALVNIDGARYSVPAQLVGATVTVKEHAQDFTIWHRNTVVATHPRQARHHVAMQPAHYAGLLRVDQTPLRAAPPQYDPRYPVAGAVMTRDLAVYEQYAAECSV